MRAGFRLQPVARPPSLSELTVIRSGLAMGEISHRTELQKGSVERGKQMKMHAVVRGVSCGPRCFVSRRGKKNFTQPHLNSFNHNDAEKIHANYEQEHYLLIC